MEFPERKQLRLPEYDYSAPGAYFVTICTQDRRCILSAVRRGDPCGRPQVELSRYGKIAQESLTAVERLFGVHFDVHVVMPNHVHFICRIDAERATARVAPTLGRIVGAYKSIAANGCRKAGFAGKLWQRGYYEHVVRSETDYREVWDYIDGNPGKWTEDDYYLPDA